MASHDAHATADHADGEIHPHPALPPVTDEAPDSPMWLPATGLALLVVLVLFAMFRSATTVDAEGDAIGGDGAAEAAEEAAPEGAAREGAAPVRAGEPGAVPTPAPAPH